MFKVLVVATSRNTRGGITSVVKAHEQGKQWQEYHCRWIETHVDKGKWTKLLWFLKGLALYLWLLPQYNLVHIHLSEPPSAIRKSVFFAFAKLFRKKTILHFHAFSPETTIGGKFKPLYRWLFSHADRVIVLSDMWKKAVANTLNVTDNVRVIYNPCTVEPSEKEYQKKNSILFAGTVNARKGYADLITAFSKIAKSYPDWKLTIAGNGEIEQGKALAKQLEIEKQVDFLGWVNGEDKDRVFKEASIFCLPSYAEGFPMAVLDAWAYRLPVITTPVGGMPDIGVDGENVLLFSPGDIEALGSKLLLLISDNALRGKIASNSYHLAESIFNIKTINKEIAKLYQEVITRK